MIKANCSQPQQICKICNKPYSTKSNLNKHMLIHSDKKLFQCDICQKYFRLKHHLVGHKMRIHVLPGIS